MSLDHYLQLSAAVSENPDAISPEDLPYIPVLPSATLPRADPSAPAFDFAAATADSLRPWHFASADHRPPGPPDGAPDCGASPVRDSTQHNAPLPGAARQDAVGSAVRAASPAEPRGLDAATGCLRGDAAIRAGGRTVKDRAVLERAAQEGSTTSADALSDSTAQCARPAGFKAMSRVLAFGDTSSASAAGASTPETTPPAHTLATEATPTPQDVTPPAPARPTGATASDRSVVAASAVQPRTWLPPWLRPSWTSAYAGSVGQVEAPRPRKLPTPSQPALPAPHASTFRKMDTPPTQAEEGPAATIAEGRGADSPAAQHSDAREPNSPTAELYPVADALASCNAADCAVMHEASPRAGGEGGICRWVPYRCDFNRSGDEVSQRGTGAVRAEHAEHLVIDCEHIGGLSRFLGRSTAPNLVCQKVVLPGAGGALLYGVACFAARDIPAMTELRWDPRSVVRGAGA
eukprot:jgi/Ulvmu1/4000/UM185_0006.1